MIKTKVENVGKGVVRIAVTMPDEEPCEIKLSKAQAEAIADTYQDTRHDTLKVRWCPWPTMQVLQRLGLLLNLGGASGRHVTALGDAVGECVREWLSANGLLPEPTRSPKRVTQHQRKVLVDFYALQSRLDLVDAIPFGAAAPERAKWHSPRTRTAHRSMVALAELEYLDVGLRGVHVDEGRLIFERDPSGVEAVFRLTVAGALYAGSLAEQ